MKRCSMLMDWKNTVKMSILLKAIYSFKTTFIQIPMVFSIETGKKNPKICMEPQKITNSQTNL